MKTLYLCMAHVYVIDTDGNGHLAPVMRLVWAENPDRAERLMHAALGGIHNFDCTPALGTPTQEPA